MKKIATILITALCVLTVYAQPVLLTKVNLPDKVTVNADTGSTTTEARLVEKVDDQTGTITSTTTTTQAVRQVEFDRAVLQTEKDHAPERIAALQAQIDVIEARVIEIDAILGVFK